MKVENLFALSSFKMSTPAYIALVAYAILGLTVILPFEYPYYNEQTDKVVIVKYDLSQRLLMLVMMAIPIALSVYSINCMMVGKCTVLSYVVSMITVFWIAIFVLTAFMYTFTNRS